MRAERAYRGQRFGEYQLCRLIRTGGMAQVYEARRVGPHGFSKRFALKRILPQLAQDPRLVGMFCDEARVHARLCHPNLVQVVDFGEQDGELFMAMEYVDGLTCADLLGAVEARRRAVDLAPALHIARDVLQGLAYAHDARDELGRWLGLVHRDVAPSNILIGRSGVVKLTDFGIMRGSFIEARTAPGEIKGKIGYISPEQATGAPLDARSDLFSLGVVFAEMLLGRPLFPGRTELEVLQRLHAGDLGELHVHGRHIPADVRAMLLRALARSPADRFATAHELLDAIGLAISEHDAAIGADGLAEWLSELGLIALDSSIRALTGETLSLSAYAAHPVDLREVAPHAEPAAAPLPAASSATVASGERSAAQVVYSMRRPGGTVVGPLSLSTLLEMIATGRVGVDTLVSRNGGPFLPAASVHELGRLAARPAYRFFDAVALRADERHAIDRATLPALLFELVRRRRTGLLAGVNGREQKRAYLFEGAPVFTASTDRDELLGVRLVAAGLIGRDALEILLERGHRSGHRLGEALIAAGAMRPSGLLRAVAAQRHARLVSLCQLARGELCFVDGASPAEESIGAPSAPMKLIASAVLDAYSDVELARLLDGVRSSALTCSAAAARLGVLLDLPAAEARVLKSIRSGEALEALVTRLMAEGLAESSVLRGVFIGLSAGALASRAWPPP
jgi:eukaryotic-like serine/threonine-protein kinase